MCAPKNECWPQKVSNRISLVFESTTLPMSFTDDNSTPNQILLHNYKKKHLTIYPQPGGGRFITLAIKGSYLALCKVADISYDPLLSIGYDLRLDVDQGRMDSGIQANMIHLPNAGFMLGHRRRRWPNVKPALGKCLMFA